MELAEYAGGGGRRANNVSSNNNNNTGPPAGVKVSPALLLDQSPAASATGGARRVRPLRSVLRRVGLRSRLAPASAAAVSASEQAAPRLESYLFEGRRRAEDGGNMMDPAGDADAPNGPPLRSPPRVSIVTDDSQSPSSPRRDDTDAGLLDGDTSGVDGNVSLLRARATVAILFAVNLLNYVDRYTINGLLMDVQSFYSVEDTEMGLITTVFMVAYLACSPLFGYLGDRYTRRYIMACGIGVWVCAVLASTFVPPQHFWLFLFLRGVVGIGEVSYATIAPTLISDLFAGDGRSRMLMVFYFAIPVGAGLGYVVGSTVAAAADDWRWGVRVTPPLGVVAILLILLLVPEPPRGQADEKSSGGVRVKHTAKMGLGAMLHDWACLAKNYTFVFASLGFTGACFAIGSLSAWIAYALQYAAAWRNPGETVGDEEKSRIALTVGMITMASGFVGVTCGQLWATRWRRTNVRADCLVCAISALAAVPFVFMGLTVASSQMWLAYLCLFLAVTLLSFNWSVVPDIIMYVVAPTRRSMATAVETTMSHLLGDAFSPTLVGAVSDMIRGSSLSAGAHFTSLQYALYIPNMVLCLAAFFFFLAALHVARDKRQALIDTHASLDGDEPAAAAAGSPAHRRPPAATASSAVLLPAVVRAYENTGYEPEADRRGTT